MGIPHIDIVMTGAGGCHNRSLHENPCSDLLMNEPKKSRLSVLFSEMVYERCSRTDPLVARAFSGARASFDVQGVRTTLMQPSSLSRKVCKRSPPGLAHRGLALEKEAKGIHYLDHQAQEYARKPTIIIAGMNKDGFAGLRRRARLPPRGADNKALNFHRPVSGYKVTSPSLSDRDEFGPRIKVNNPSLLYENKQDSSFCVCSSSGGDCTFCCQ